MYGYKESEIFELVNKAEEAKNKGESLGNVFEDFGENTGRAKGSVRNTYYRLLRDSETDDSIRKKYFPDSSLKVCKIIAFDNIEAENLLKKILVGRTLGKSVRKIINEISKKDDRLMLRYQNKYRNMLKNNRDEVEEVIADIRNEYGRCFNPYVKAEKSKDAALKRLRTEINGLAERLGGKYKNENERLKGEVAKANLEIARLRELLKSRFCHSSVVKDYFENIDNGEKKIN